MFAAAFLAKREWASELQRRVAEAEAQRDVTTAALHEADAALARVVQGLMSAETRRADGETVLLRVKDGLTLLRAALAAAADVARCWEELKAAETLESEASQARATAEQSREARRGELWRAQENHKLALAGIVDPQPGLKKLHRRVGAHRQVMRRRREAESLLGISELRTDKLAVHFGECRARLAEVNPEQRDGAQRLTDASTHREAYETALAALRTLINGEPASDAVHAVALDALHTWRELWVLANRVPALVRKSDAACTQAARQSVVRGRAATLGVEPGAGPASEQVWTFLAEVDAEQRRHEDEERTARASLAQVERTLAEMNTRRRELSKHESLWQELDARGRRLGEATSLEVSGSTHDASRPRAHQ